MLRDLFSFLDSSATHTVNIAFYYCDEQQSTVQRLQCTHILPIPADNLLVLNLIKQAQMIMMLYFSQINIKKKMKSSSCSPIPSYIFHQNKKNTQTMVSFYPGDISDGTRACMKEPNRRFFITYYYALTKIPHI